MNNKSIIVFAAHPDDEVLGCGGTIAKFSQLGFKVYVVFFSDGETSRDSKKVSTKLISQRIKSAIKSCKILGVQKPFFHNFPDNQLDKIPLLKIIKLIESYIRKYKPRMVFTHFGEDLNIDHKVVSQATITACRPQKGNLVKQLFFFEIPSSTDWQIKNKKKAIFNPNWFEDISKTQEKKLKALKAYSSELRAWPHPRSIKGIKSLMQWRGSTSGFKAAEAFMLGRLINK